MRLITNKYELNYVDTYENGIMVDGFQVIIEGVYVDIEYSRETNEIVSLGAMNDENEDVCEDTKERAIDLVQYMSFEIRTACKFLLDIM